MLDVTGKSVRITGVLHAGTRDPNDFTVRYGMDKWAKGFEQTILSIADEVYLGSNYHKQLIENDVLGIKAKLKVTGLFFDANEVMLQDINPVKEKIIVFPHRLAPEKHPEEFDALIDRFQDKYPDRQFVKTAEATQGKKAYYNLLQRASIAISFNGQETFGYSMLESIAAGCIPLAFNGKSYVDTVPSRYRWDDTGELDDKLTKIILDKERQEGYKDIRLRKAAVKYNNVDVARKMFLGHSF